MGAASAMACRRTGAPVCSSVPMESSARCGSVPVVVGAFQKEGLTTAGKSQAMKENKDLGGPKFYAVGTCPAEYKYLHYGKFGHLHLHGTWQCLSCSSSLPPPPLSSTSIPLSAPSAICPPLRTAELTMTCLLTMTCPQACTSLERLLEQWM
eukprot:3273679-Rhodomonas_salina.1